MAKIKNVSPLGDLIIPALNGLIVKAGEVANVSDEAAAALLAQPENWVAADKAAASITSIDSAAPTAQN
jgi:uncharacterized membrane protein